MHADEVAERVEAGGLGRGNGRAEVAAALAVGVAVEVERHGVADEAVLDVDLGERVGFVGVVAKLDLAAAQLGADLEAAAVDRKSVV